MRPLKRTEIRRFVEKTNQQFPVQKEIIFLLANVERSPNVGSIFRLAEGMNAQVWLTGHTPTPPDPDIGKTSMGQEKRVVWQHIPQASLAIKKACDLGFTPIAIELCQEAVSYHVYKYPAKICFVLGNENSGVHAEILSMCKAAVFIPYWGKNYSLNVAMCAAIISYHAQLQS